MRLILAGTASGAGKTSVCLALAAGLDKKGLRFSGFKAGPDYLDPKYMEAVTGRACYNLDPWMSSQDHVRELIAGTSGIALIEGVMGYYDGADVSDSSGSTAHLAEILHSPVILVANARAMARSFGALIKGYVEFEKSGLRIEGIIANNCGSLRHIDILSRVLDSSGLPPLLGGIPSKALPVLGSRHLGLKVPDKEKLDGSVLNSFAEAADNYLDLDRIVSLAGEEKEPQQVQVQGPVRPARVRIAVARDKAFNFYYQANLDILEKAGAELVYFSPVTDKRIPEDVGMLYLGGGYPELFAYELSQNRALRKDILNYIQSGGHVYAECGGLIYLCIDLKVSGGQVFPMTGALPFKASMLSRRKSLGYVQISFLEDCLLGERGQTIRGHEYHYSQIDPVNGEVSWKNIYQVVNSRKERKDTLGIRTGNILAGYSHVYFGHRPEVAERIVRWISD